MALPSSIIMRDTRANQPAATAVAAGTLYYVTDENLTEYSDGATWESYTDGGGAIGGSTGGTDEAVLVADGTGGATLQATPVTIASSTGAITFPDNVRQTFNPGANAAGLNVGAHAGDPDTPVNGDLWYDSSAEELTARIDGVNVPLGLPEVLGYAISDETTALTTGAGKLTVIAPFAFTLTKVRAFVTTAPTDADLEIDVNKNGTSVLSTVISIDATENDSDDSAAAAVISTASFADGDLIRFDIDQIGSTTAGAGAKVWLYVYRA